MIAQRHRFHGRGGLKAVYQRGTGVRGAMIGLKHLERKPDQPYRVAVVVSRKVHKSAVQRNRIRRRIYEICRQTDPELVAAKDLVFTAFSDKLAAVPAPQLQSAIEDLLRKATSVAKTTKTPVGRGIVKQVKSKGNH
jgi:ribonuclease P protein component